VLHSAESLPLVKVLWACSCSGANGTPRLAGHTYGLQVKAIMSTKPLRMPAQPKEWGAEHLQQWFETHKSGKYDRYKKRFSRQDGEELSEMTLDQLIEWCKEVDGEYGRDDAIVIFNHIKTRVGDCSRE
jgi:hypothetical protein